jgi:hypothetical protein
MSPLAGSPQNNGASLVGWREAQVEKRSSDDRLRPFGNNRDTHDGGQEDVKKLKNWFGEISALKKVAPGCPVSDRWGVGIHFASA